MCNSLPQEISDQLKKNKETATSLLLRLQSRYKEIYKDYDDGSQVSYVERVVTSVEIETSND